MRDFGNTLVSFFMLPGDYLLSQLGLHLPISDSAILPAIVSLLAWVLAGAVAWAMLRLIRNLLRIIGAVVRTTAFRISQAAGNFKTRLVCQIRRLFPHRQNSEPVPDVELDDLDIAVLRSAAACGPGFATSAPELAEQLMMRPSQVQRHLDKLRKNNMLDTIIGSTEGFDNYHLSKSGATFMSMWRRNLH